MKRRTFLKGLFATTVSLPLLPALGTVEQDYSFTITQLEVVKSNKNFTRLVRGLAILDARPEHSCSFCYEVYDDDLDIVDTLHNAKPTIRSHFISRFGNIYGRGRA